MKLSLPAASLALSRLKRRLTSMQRSLQRTLEGWMPTPAPALVPIPIRVERHARGPVGRRPDRRG